RAGCSGGKTAESGRRTGTAAPRAAGRSTGAMRRVLAAFKIALRALFRNKTRAFLTMLGIICGVAAVITTVSLGQGAKAQIEAQIASLGQNVIQVGSGSVTRGGIHTGW